MYTINATVKLFVIAMVSLISASISAAESTAVTIGNFVRAESDHMIRTKEPALQGDWMPPKAYKLVEGQ